MTASDWRDQASCRTVDSDLFFPIGYRTPTCWRQINTAARVCLDCPVRRQCLDYALADPALDGVWAGSTPAQRDFIRRRQGYRPRPHTPHQGTRSGPSGAAERRHEVRTMHAGGTTQAEIAETLGITQQAVSYLLNTAPREVEAAS